MKIFFLRHGRAEERNAELYPDDSRRPLTKGGRSRMKKISKFMVTAGIKPEIIISSPYVRAVETAGIVARETGLKGTQMIVSDYLVPGSNYDGLIKEVRSIQGLSGIMVVGHEPDLSGLISLLLTGRSGVPIRLKKGSICCLSLTSITGSRCATLEWLVTPSIAFVK